MKTWIETFGSQLRPEILVWTNSADECVGACVVTLKQERIGPFQVRAAYLNATGASAVMSEHNILLAVPDYAPRVARELASYLRSQHVEAMFLDGFRARDARLLAGAFANNRSPASFISEDRYVPLGELRAARTSYLDTLSKSTRKAIDRSIRLMTVRDGAPSFEVAGGPEQALAFFDELREVHGAFWRRRGDSGAFASTGAMRFHRSLIAAGFADSSGLESGLHVDICRMRFGDTPIGWLYCLRNRGIVSFLQSAFAYGDDNRLKPGLVTHSFAAQHYLDSGELEYDFLAGEATPVRYKSALATAVRPLHWDRLAARTPRMSCIHVMHNAKRYMSRRAAVPVQGSGSLVVAQLVQELPPL